MKLKDIWDLRIMHRDTHDGSLFISLENNAIHPTLEFGAMYRYSAGAHSLIKIKISDDSAFDLFVGSLGNVEAFFNACFVTIFIEGMNET